jgi:hypothetical protein
MRTVILSIRGRLDRVGVLLSGLCALHCIAGLVLVTGLGLGGGPILDPAIHRIGLALAIAVAMLTLGIGAIRHGQRGPLLLGGAGIMLMSLALLAGHGQAEAVLTVGGVSLVAFAHIRNLRHAG